MPIINRIAEFHAEMAAWRQDLYAHPELALQEVRTSGVVQRMLAECRTKDGDQAPGKWVS